GLASAIIMASRGGGVRSIKAFFSPHTAYLKGNGIVIISLIFFTAIIFGYAHIASGVGWKIGKLTTATIAGAVLGWVYIKSGLASAIILHWCFNFLMGSFKYFDRALNASLTSLVEIVIVISALGIVLATSYKKYIGSVKPR
ncbi:MAG: CPBP family intramembrane glutamic endopeptidase, partial [Nitrososphaerota archaeon]